MNAPPPIETLRQMLREREPNLLRLYLNPHVAQACFCLDRYARAAWPGASALDAKGREEPWQTFLANGLEEAVGGAIKLWRYNRPDAVATKAALVLDPADRLSGFADWRMPGGERIEFLPGIDVVGAAEFAERSDRLGRLEAYAASYDAIVLVAGDDGRLDAYADAIRGLARRGSAFLVCLDRDGLARIREGRRDWMREVRPEVVVFDDSFAGGEVPFGAFTARQSLFAAWNKPSKSTFHSTTFQPNTISARHFMNCLRAVDRDFAREHAADLSAMEDDVARRGEAFGRHYNPSLLRLIRTAGFATADVKAVGGDVLVNGTAIIDFVGGVACSLRGHNPPDYADALASMSEDVASVEEELGRRFGGLTGLGRVLPAVSGGTAVENALKLALVAQHPKRKLLALKAGFGGKTLFSLTSTANPSYKDRIGPLYAEVEYVDPFAPDALSQVERRLATGEFAAAQLELIQSVGGVRQVPEPVVRLLDEGRSRWGHLLIVDEIQTGMYRTGPFSRSETLGLTADFMLLGKGTSDMMFPFSLTLYTDAVADRLKGRADGLVAAIRERYGYETGLRTVLQALRAADELGLSGRVAELGARFERVIREKLGDGGKVRDVRVFGLLLAIEVDESGPLRRRLGKRLAASYLLAMLRHERSPLFAGFCQYEPNTLKITPPLTVRPDEIDRACETIADVLKRPFPRVLAAALARLLRPTPYRKGHDEHGNRPAAPELAAR